MIWTSESSQVLALLPQNSLRLLQQIKLLLLLWKFQPILAKMLAKGKKLKLLRARTKATIREKTRLQTLGQAALGEESQNLGALGCPNHSICSQVVLGWN